MTNSLARAKVVATATVTRLVAVAVVLPLVADDLAQVMPGQAEAITHGALVVAGWIGAAVAIIRRVTPVVDGERGLLPADQQ
jgi:hypothetical protein